MTDLKFTSPSGETTLKVEDTGRIGTVTPKTQLHIKMDEPVKYETPMTELEEVKAQLKVLQKKLSFLEELEKTKSPVEEAYKRVYAEYPMGEPFWVVFKNGYEQAQEDYKVGEYQETAQERGERVHNEMEETIKIHDGYGVVDYKPTPQSPVEEAYKDWWGEYPGDENWTSDATRWQGFQAGYNAAYEEKVAQEPEENEWKSVALRFGEKLSGYLSDGYYELSPDAWFRWAVFTYGKGQQKDYKVGVNEPSMTNCVLTGNPPNGYVAWNEWYNEMGSKGILHNLKISSKDYKPTPQERGERVHKEMEELVRESVKWCEENPDKDPLDWLKPQTPEQTAQSLKKAFVEAQQTEKWKETQKLIDEEDNDKNFKNSLDLIKEWGEKNKPPTLKELLWEWWEDIFTVDSDLDADASIDVLVDIIDKKFIPPSSEKNGYEWEKCLKIMRDKLR